ncbi:MAG: UvrD-helicase domain-containing protein, partial [Myxococcales bacterium]|nr:UvrD-helicase domain-containing protein [Myxococcales bacterium]
MVQRADVIDLEGLNPPQREAVLHRDSPLVVFAGAGSGKTRVITYRIAQLVQADGVAPYRILAVTFTNKAAGEMRARLSQLLSIGPRGLWVGTFHATCARILREYSDRIGIRSDFTIYDDQDQQAMVKRILRDLKIDEKRYPPKLIAGVINRSKQDVVAPDEMVIRDPIDDVARRVYAVYEEKMAQGGTLDFGDLLYRVVRALEADEGFRKELSRRFSHVLVDEFQDTNHVQWRLVHNLCRDHRSLCVVGDDDQSIYAWRGADRRNILDFRRHFPDAHLIKLEQNYRSVQTILHAANTLIARNPKLHPKTLYSELGVGDPVSVTPCDDDAAEAESVVMRLQGLKFERRSKFADFAILYRGNYQARIVEKALREQRIPYRISGGQSFFEKAEIRDLIAYLRLLANEDDDPAFIRAITTPKRGVGSSTLAALGTYAGQRHLSMYAAMFETGMDSRTPARPLAEMRRFGEFINRLSHRSRNEPAAQLLDEMVAAIDYQAHLYG